MDLPPKPKIDISLYRRDAARARARSAAPPTAARPSQNALPAAEESSSSIDTESTGVQRALHRYSALDTAARPLAVRKPAHPAPSPPRPGADSAPQSLLHPDRAHSVPTVQQRVAELELGGLREPFAPGSPLDSRGMSPRRSSHGSSRTSSHGSLARFDRDSTPGTTRSTEFSSPEPSPRASPPRVSPPLRTSPPAYEHSPLARSPPVAQSPPYGGPRTASVPQLHAHDAPATPMRRAQTQTAPPLPARSRPASVAGASLSRPASVAGASLSRPASFVQLQSPPPSRPLSMAEPESPSRARDDEDDRIALTTHNVLKREPPRLAFAAKPRRILASSARHVLVVSASKPRVELYALPAGTLLWKEKLLARTALFVDEEVWIGLHSGQIHVYGIDSGVAHQKLDKQHSRPVTMLARNAEQVMSVSQDDGKVCVWPLAGGRPLSVHRVLGVPTSSAAGGDPMVLYTTKEHRVDVYTAESNFLPFCHNLPRKGANLGVCTAMTTRGSTLFCGQNDGNISIFHSQQRVGTLNAGIHSVTALAVSQAGELWAGTSAGEMLVFSVSLADLSATLVRQCKVSGSAVTEIGSAGAAMLVLDRNSELVSYSAEKTPAYAVESPTREPPKVSKAPTVLASPVRAIEPAAALASPHASAFKVSVLTWNVGSCRPEAVEPQWLLMHGDVLVYGLQEVTELESKQQQVVTMLGSTPEEHDAWRVYLEQLNTVRGFKLASFKEMVGILTCVFVRTNIDVRDVNVKLVKTGMGGTYGNKGGVVTSLVLDGVAFDFVNVHLAAGQSSVMQRNKDAAQVLAACPPAQYTFFLGDTNYRLNTVRERAFQLIQQLDFASLQRLDQLKQQVSKNPSFILSQFAEGELSFAPTYKFDRMTSRYDTSDKKRVPAYCDRILFLGAGVRVDYYSSINTLCSDHKAVVGYYTVQPR